MFRKRDFPSVLLLSTLLILVILTLSQILVVHNGTMAKHRLSMRKLQIEMRELDFALHSVMKHRVPSMELNRRLLQNEINGQRFQHILQEASKTGTGGADIHGDIINSSSLSLLHRDKEGTLPADELVTAIEEKASRKDDKISRDLSSNRLDGVVLKRRGKSGKGVNINPVHSTSNSTSNMAVERDTELSTARSIISPQRIPAGTKPLLPLQQSNSPPLDITVLVGSRALVEEGKGALTPDSSDGGRGLSKRGNTTAMGLLGTDSDRNFNQPSPGSNREPVSHKATSSYCPAVPPHLKGTVPINFTLALMSGDEDIVGLNPGTEPGGSWRPGDCVARHRVAVVIPYRDRRQHLYGLLYYLHPMLQKQQLDYTIFVVEQQGNDTFNKATLMNIAFTEGLKLFPFQCVLFHDVDLVPENDRNMYSCPQQPRHLSVAIDEMGYKLAYPELVGGVLNLRTEHFQRVNGYSNLYWGWGAEDDDMAYRIMQVGLKITRPPGIIARYKMIKHKKREPANWKKRAKLLITGPRRFQFDGLNSMNYELVHIEKRPLFTHILVNVGKPPRGFS